MCSCMEMLASVTWVQVRFMHFSGSVTLCPTSSSRVKLEYLHKSSPEAGHYTRLHQLHLSSFVLL